MFSLCLFAKVSISQRTEKQPLVSFTHMALVPSDLHEFCEESI